MNNQIIIDELNDLYVRLGRITYWEYFNAEEKWGSSVDKRIMINRMKELTDHLVQHGYGYDWYKGWTKDMVTTPVL